MDILGCHLTDYLKGWRLIYLRREALDSSDAIEIVDAKHTLDSAVAN